MPQGDDSLLLHFLPWTVMLLIMLGNRFTAQRRLERRAAREDQGLRTILHMELAELLLVYDENLRHIIEHQPCLVSGRPFLMVSKGNLGRLALLDPPAIASVISAIAFNERIEGAISMHSKPVGNTIYRLDPNSELLEMIREKLLVGREKIRLALAALQSAGDPEPAPPAPCEKPFLAPPALLAPAAAEP